MKLLRLTLALCATALLCACGDEPAPPPSVQEFMDDPILLDATMVRCVANRDSVSHDPECVNAREAVERMAAAVESARRAAMEAESERKREALRRAQQAADEAHRLAAEAERLQEEARLLGLAPVVTEDPESGAASLSEGESGGEASVTVLDAPPARQDVEAAAGEPSAAGAELPVVTPDLEEIREELEQRQSAPPPETS